MPTIPTLPPLPPLPQLPQLPQLPSLPSLPLLPPLPPLPPLPALPRLRFRHREPSYIPLRRFLTHFSLSLLAVGVVQLLCHILVPEPPQIILLLSWNISYIIGYGVFTLLLGRNGHKLSWEERIYGAAVSLAVASINVVTFLLGIYVKGQNEGGGWGTRQHIATHFCLVFWIISEMEFYRAYINFRLLDTSSSLTCVDYVKHVLRANVDTEFIYSRDPFHYYETLSAISLHSGNQIQHPDAYDKPKTWQHRVFAFSNLHTVCSAIRFYAACAVSYFAVKMVVNPGDSDEDVRCALFGVNILFGKYPVNMWEGVSGFMLLRIVRQANYVACWLVRNWGEWRAKSKEGMEESLLPLLDSTM